MDEVPHIHKFVIPIEWAYENSSTLPSTYINSSGLKSPTTVFKANRKWVTKLMCECGEVKEL